MSASSPNVGWPPHAQQVAWFEAWLCAVRSANPAGVALAQAELRRLGVEVAPASPGGRP